jgi:hypothetical protein
VANSNLSTQGSAPAGAYIQPAPGIVISAKVDTDVNGNIVQSVAGPTSGYAYFGISAFRDAWTTVQVNSTAAAPAAAAVVATITPGTAGLWEISGATWVTGTVAAAVDSNNMGLYQTAAARYSPIPLTITSTTASTAPMAFIPVILNLSGTDTVNIKAIASATASSVYQATIVARRVG